MHHGSSFPRILLTGAAVIAGLCASRAADWHSLFNGRDLSGWTVVHDARFEAVEGNLHLVRGAGWLRSNEEYGNFILEVEIRPRVERYDSGLFFRAGLDGKPWPADAWQVNLRRDMWGALVKGFSKVIGSTMEGPDIEENTPWSKFHLEVRGPKAVLHVNGLKAWETDKIDRARGYIGIQAEDREFEFRNFRLQVLDENKPTPAKP
jgi:hypothetical protein